MLDDHGQAGVKRIEKHQPRVAVATQHQLQTATVHVGHKRGNEAGVRERGEGQVLRSAQRAVHNDT